MSKLHQVLLSVVAFAMLAIIISWICHDVSVEIVSLIGVALAIGFFGAFLGQFTDGEAQPWTREDMANAFVWTIRAVYCFAIEALTFWVSGKIFGWPAIACFAGILAGQAIWATGATSRSQTPRSTVRPIAPTGSYEDMQGLRLGPSDSATQQPVQSASTRAGIDALLDGARKR